MRTRSLHFCAVIVVLAVTTGCSDGRLPTEPTSTAPDSSPVPSPQPPAAPGGATINGTVASGVAASPSAQRTLTGPSLTVSAIGTNISASVGGDGRFTLNGVPAMEVLLRFTGTGVDATLRVGAVSPGAVLNITVSVHGSTAELLDASHQHGTKVELEGPIESISPGTRRIVVRGRTVQVPDHTIIRHGDRRFTFADLHVGDRVHVKGDLQGDIVMAIEIFLQNPAGPGPGPKPPKTADALSTSP